MAKKVKPVVHEITICPNTRYGHEKSLSSTNENNFVIEKNSKFTIPREGEFWTAELKDGRYNLTGKVSDAPTDTHLHE